MRIAIIGAGLAGLTAAYELRDHDVDIYEAEDRIGGKLYTVPFNDGPTDIGAEAYLALRTDATEFFTELGLADRLVAPSGAGSLVYAGGQLHPLPREAVMGIPARGAAVAGIVSPSTVAAIDAEATAEPIAWTAGADISVGQLVRERYGDEVADRLVSAMLGGVYSCAADDLGLRATIPALAEVLDNGPTTLSAAVQTLLDARPLSAPGSGAGAGSQNRPPVFYAFRGGYADLYETLAEKSGARIFVDAFISGIDSTAQGFRIRGGEDLSYDRVLVTTPAPTTARLLPQLDALRSVKLASSVVVGMKFDDATGLPDNSGILVAADCADIHAKAFTLSSKKWPHVAQRGGALVRASFGRFGDDAIVRAAEDDLVDLALADLEAITGFDGRAAGLSEIFTQRWFGGLPRFDATHLDTVARTREQVAELPGIDIAGAWAGGVGVPAVIADARAAAARLVGN